MKTKEKQKKKGKTFCYEFQLQNPHFLLLSFVFQEQFKNKNYKTILYVLCCSLLLISKYPFTLSHSNFICYLIHPQSCASLNGKSFCSYYFLWFFFLSLSRVWAFSCEYGKYKRKLSCFSENFHNMQWKLFIMEKFVQVLKQNQNHYCYGR